MARCKELIAQHESTFNYHRLAELHVSGLQSSVLLSKWWLMQLYHPILMYFVQVDDHITVLQQDPDGAEGRPAVLPSVLLWRLPTLLQSEGNTKYCSTPYSVCMVHWVADGVCTCTTCCVGQDLCVSWLGVWEVAQFSGTSLHHVPQCQGTAQLHAVDHVWHEYHSRFRVCSLDHCTLLTVCNHVMTVQRAVRTGSPAPTVIFTLWSWYAKIHKRRWSNINR